MYIIKSYQTAVTLFSRSGAVRTFASKAEALRELGYTWIRNHVAAQFCTWSHMEYRAFNGRPAPSWEMVTGNVRVHPVYTYADFIMRDDAGSPLVIGDLAPVRRRRPYYRQAMMTWNGGGPVPYTGRRRGGHYFRHVKTTNERRAAQLVDDTDVAPRGRRNANNLANSWDDYYVTSREDRNWKRFRKTQFKA